MASDRYTLAYRAAETQQVMNWLKAGQSACLIGLRGVGVSNFLHFLLHPEVRQHYLGPAAVDFIVVLVDLLALTEQSEQAFYELVLNRLELEFNRLELKIPTHSTPTPPQRALEQRVAIFCQQPPRRLILIFDEFGPIFQNLSASLFRHLRAIRDAHKDQVCYLIAVNNDLADLRHDLSEVEHFCRLVSRNVCYLTPYNPADTRQMMTYLTARRFIELSETDIISPTPPNQPVWPWPQPVF